MKKSTKYVSKGKKINHTKHVSDFCIVDHRKMPLKNDGTTFPKTSNGQQSGPGVNMFVCLLLLFWLE